MSDQEFNCSLCGYVVAGKCKKGLPMRDDSIDEVCPGGLSNTTIELMAIAEKAHITFDELPKEPTKKQAHEIAEITCLYCKYQRFSKDIGHEKERICGLNGIQIENLNCVCWQFLDIDNLVDIKKATKKEIKKEMDLIKQENQDLIKGPLHYKWTDVGNAIRLIDMNEDELLYCHIHGCWYNWDNSRWIKDENGEIVRRSLKAIDKMYDERDLLTEPERSKFIKFILESQNSSRISGMIKLAQSDIRTAIKPDKLDNNKNLLNTPGGVYDLDTGIFRPHDKKDYITKTTNVMPKKMDISLWTNDLNKWLNNDADDIRFIQKAVGVSLSGFTNEHCMFILHGSGRNGKSTFIETIRYILGDYAINTPVDTLLQKQSGGIPNDIARLPGARLVIAMESDEGARLNESLIKQMTGGDMMTARFLQHEFFDFEPQFKLWLATNNEPDIREISPALWSRIRKIPFNVYIPPEERDPKLKDKLKEIAPGILQWAIEGYELYKLEGLTPSKNIADATKEYQDNMDIVEQFITARCDTIDKTAIERSSQLFAAFQSWNDNAKFSQIKFNRRMSQKGFKLIREARGKYWNGIALKNLEQVKINSNPVEKQSEIV